MPRVVSIDQIACLPAGLKGAVVAIGNFDGVHRGHQSVLARARSLAQKKGVPAVVLTFEPHPRSFFTPQQPVFRLTEADKKAALIRALGFDATVSLVFDAHTAALSAADFIQKILVDGLAVSGLVVGFDFQFGKGRSGTGQTLQEAAQRHGFEVDIVPPFMSAQADEAVSSTLVRTALAQGDMAAANAALGWRWSVNSTVLHGDKRGRVLGYPTANMTMPAATTLKQGVYAVRVRVDGAWFSGAANYGRRIQFGEGPVWLETHILDFSGDVYGRRLEVEFCGFLREEARFDSVEQLVEQMGYDCDKARQLISSVLRAPSTPLQAALEH